MYPKIINIKSSKKNNFFAPEWNYYIVEDIIKNIKFDLLSKFLLKKEKEILKIKNNSNKIIKDGYTGLGENSVTSRHLLFNIFNFNNTEINKIKKHIIEIHNKFLNYLKIEIPKNLWIQCWFNVMRKGESIKAHIHGTSPDTYLGGHICVQVEKTSTNYINPVNQINDPEIYYSKNEIGKITLFQNCIPHFTDMHNSNKERITIAFDLSVINKNNNFIKLI